MRNHKLAKAISDAGRGCAQVASSDALSHSALRWGMFVNFLSYKLEREDKKLVEIDRFFPSSHICPECLTQQPKMDLSVRKWICVNKACNSHHDRDEAASRNIRAEGVRMHRLQSSQVASSDALNASRSVADGAAVSASGGSVRQDRGRKTKVMQHLAKLETLTS